MADYRDMISGTIRSVVGKVKEVADSDAVRGIVDKVKEAADSDSVRNIVGKVREAAETTNVREIYEPVAGKARTYGSIAKLSLEINADHEELKRVYAEIGKLYYDEAKAEPHGFFSALFAQAEAIERNIRSKEDQIAALRAEAAAASSEPDIDVEITEFEEIVADTAADGAGVVEEAVTEAVTDEVPADSEENKA